MTDSSELRAQLSRMLGKARRALKAARLQLEAGDSDFAASRSYYAAFYAMEAALLSKEMVFSKHSAVISAFNLHFVKSGLCTKETGKKLNRLFRERQAADYEFDDSIPSRQDADEDILAAHSIVDEIAKYLRAQRLISE